MAIAAHLGCGLRLVLRPHEVRGRISDLAPPWAIGAGVIISSIILVGLPGLHIT